MKLVHLSFLAALVWLGLISDAQANQVLAQKGNPCSAVWELATATATPNQNLQKPWSLSCEDGDPSCDSDGLPNGTCVIDVNACIMQQLANCAPEAVTAITFPGATTGRIEGFVPPGPGSVAACGTAGRLSLDLRRKPKNPNKPLRRVNPSKPVTLKIKKFTTATGNGKNFLKVQCIPPAVGCPLRDPASLPAQLTLTVPPPSEARTDLDSGYTGNSHNFPVINGSQLKYCLSECDGESDNSCVLNGTAGAGATLNGPTFGAPVPLLSSGVPVCLINRFRDPVLTGTMDLVTGEGTGPVNLTTDIIVTGNTQEICPRCLVTGGGGQLGSAGRCSSTASTPNAPCRVNGLSTVFVPGTGNTNYTLSTECVPTQQRFPIMVDLPLTTGAPPPLVGALPCAAAVGQTQDDNCGAGATCDATCTGDACVTTQDPGAPGQCIDIKGGISQVCCSNQTSRPCFPSRSGAGRIERQGRPAVPGGPAGVFAATFCIPRSGAPTVDGVAGLPGPGTLLLPARAVVTPEQQQ